MKRAILTQIIFIFISFMSLHAQWAKTYGGSHNESLSSIQQTSDEGYIIAGSTESFGAGHSDIWILKLDSNGEIEWQQTYGGGNNDFAKFIQQTTDGGYIILSHTYSFGVGFNDIWILKLNSIGDIEWQYTYGGSSSDYAHSIQQTSDGGYVVAGCTFSFGNGSNDGWVLKLNSTGDIEWQRTYGESGKDCADSIQQTSDGGYVVGGYTESFGAGFKDIWFLKLDSYGEIEWQGALGGGNNEYSSSIQQTSDEGYIIAGYTESTGFGGSDVWIIRLNSEGDIEWHYIYGGTGYDYAHSIQQTSDEGYIISGCTYSFGHGYNDGWVLKLDSIGDIEWQYTYGGSNSDCADSIQQTSDGGYVAAGYTESFGAGNYDIWVLKLDSLGKISPSCGFDASSDAATSFVDFMPIDTLIMPGGTTIIPTGTSVYPLDTDATVTLLCTTQKYTLSISSTPGGTTDPSPDTYTEYGGTKVTLTAIPDSGYGFSEWSGDASGSENPITIIMDKNKSITANFIRQHRLEIVAGEGGTTHPAPGSHSYNVGTVVSITAIPETDYRFSGWTGDVAQGSENKNPLSITIDSDKSITANFTRPYQLKITAGEGGTTDPAPGTYTYNSGTEVKVKAIPEEGYKFSEWSVDAYGSENPITITVDKDKWIVAIFKPINEEDESGDWKLNCFIATAAYDSPFHPYVEILRNFRDKYLMSSKLGQKLVKLYYKHSPFIANIIAKNKFLKIAVRISLVPLVAFSYSMLHFGPKITVFLFALIFVLPVFIFRFYQRKIRSSKINS